MNYNQHRQKQDLKSGRGWIYFILGCLLALFLGGAVRVALSPRRIQTEISSRLEKAKVNVAIEGLQVSLNSGIWPRFGFFSSRMTITPKLTCEIWSEIVVENLYLPVGWYNHALAFRTVEADHVHIRMRKGPCAEQSAAVASSAVKEGSNTKAEADVDLTHRWQSEVSNFQKYLSYVRIHNLVIETNHDKELVFQNVNLAAENWPVQLRLDWMLSGVGWIQTVLLGNQQQLGLQFTSAVKEGEAQGVASVNLQDGQLKSDLNIRHWPLQHVLDQAQLWGAHPNFTAKSTWLSCHIRSETPWTELRNAPLYFDDCAIAGSLGAVRVEDLKMRVGEFEKISPFKIIVEKLDVRNVLQSLGREGLSGVLTDFGWLSGVVEVKSAKDFLWKGQLHDVVLYFSNNGHRAVQKISSMLMDLQFDGDRVLGQLRDFELDQGKLTGQVNIELDKDMGKGVIQVQAPLVELHPDVQKIMVDGQFSGVSLKGRAMIAQGEIRSWTGEIDAEKIASRYLVAQAVKVVTDFADQKLSAHAKVGRLTVDPNHSLYQKLAAAFAPAEKSAPLLFKVQDVQLTIDRNGLQWNKLMAKSKLQNISGHGFWQFDGPVNGEMVLDSPKAKWLFKGPSSDWQLVKAADDGSFRD